MTNRLTKQALSISALLVLVLNIVAAQNTGKISGIILDAQTGDPLIGTNVVVLGTSLGASTDLEGAYFILNIPAGKYDLQASMVGYEKIIQRGVIVNSGRTTDAIFKLKPTAFEQDAVIIEATRPDVEPEKTSTSTILRNDDVQHMAGMRDVGDVIGLAADVTDGHFRGGRAGEELYTLQGMGITNPLDNTNSLLPIMSAVEEVEVVTSGFGAQYGNAQSGIVNITMKEGKSDKWRSYAEINTRMPGKKYFGASPLDSNANTYLRTLSGEAAWHAANDPENPGYGYWTSMGVNGNSLARDTAAQIAMARTLWGQLHRYMNNAMYDNNLDYTVEFSAGGPLSESMRMFLAFRQSSSTPPTNNVPTSNSPSAYPVEHPDINQQIMGNIVTDFGGGATLRISAAYGLYNTNVFPSLNSSTPGFYRFLWDDILSIQRQIVTNFQAGLRFTQALNQKTFYEIKINTLVTRKQLGSSPYPQSIPDSILGNSGWSTMMMLPVNSPDGFVIGTGQQAFNDDKTQTISLDASITSQITKSHLINAGIQANWYNLDISEHTNMGNTYPLYNDYTAKPREAALYLQDKMEFQGMIANIGLRLDAWDQNTTYNPNIYRPYYDYDTTTSQYVNVGKALYTSRTPIIGRLQPRVGISFPVSVTTVFHLNYGTFMQRPAFQYIFDSRNTVNSGGIITANNLGNPVLKPQMTNSYDVGVMHGFGDGFTLDLSGYYKDVKDLIQQSTFIGNGNTGSFTTYVNRDYADIRGFRIVLNKRSGNFLGSLNYQYSVASGKSSGVSSANPTFKEDGTTSERFTKDLLMDFDRAHNVLINLGYVTGDRLGFLSDITVSSHSSLRSGRPFTYNSTASGVFDVNNQRTPWEYNTDVKITKRLHDFFGVEASLYLEVFNLFNNRRLNYNYIFQADGQGNQNANLPTYMTTSMDDPNSLRFQNDKYYGKSQLSVDKEFLIYSNQPRSFNVGLSFDF
jgi:outer membrane receptor protein involved in Fe transport